MQSYLQAFIILPLIGFFIILLLPRKNERAISFLASFVSIAHVIAILAFSIYWITQGRPDLFQKEGVLFSSSYLEIFISFYFDIMSAVFAMIGALIGFLVIRFSKFYLHRDQGYKRFFATVMLFLAGYNIIVFAGNFETLFIGWEALGICSFILIAYYRDRYLPVKNAMKVISYYRLGDVCLILAMWLSHHLWHKNISFDLFNNSAVMADHLQHAGWYAFALALLIVIAAAIKSAQFPFSAWLPRAMEGPTTSSAIFYGSLSVHLGAFLLLRTYPYWESFTGIKILIIAIGVITCLVATSVASVQSTVKTQIAYASITQMGFIFIEIALGWHVIALIHFAANAFLRTYQLLVSPSVLSYAIHDMMVNFKPSQDKPHTGFMKKLSSSLYILSLKEWNLDRGITTVMWQPFKFIGQSLQTIGRKPLVMAGIFLALIALAGVFTNNLLPVAVTDYLPGILAFFALGLVLLAFTERVSVTGAWWTVIIAHILIALAVTLMQNGFTYEYLLIYLSGILIAGLIGFLCLKKLSHRESGLDLNGYHGHSYEHPLLAIIFFVACLAVAGLPFTPTFIGIDILFSYIGKQQYLFIAAIALSFIFIELCLLRIYSRIFMGQHEKPYHPIAYRSS